MGSEGDMGGYHLDGLSAICPLQDSQTQGLGKRYVDSDPRVYLPADMLVGHQLPSLSPRHFGTRLLIFRTV